MGSSGKILARMLLFGAVALFLLPDRVMSQQTPEQLNPQGKRLFEQNWRPIEKPTTEIDLSRFFGVERFRSLRSGAIGNRDVAHDVALGDGLGPLHNATSCAACHAGGGASGVEHNVTLITIDPRSKALKYKRRGGEELLELFPGLIGPAGQFVFSSVVHDRSTRPGYAEIRSRLADFVPGGIADEWFRPKHRTSEAIAKRPVVAGRHGSIDFYLSQRNSPPLFGVGIIDSIRVDRIEALARKQAEDSDGKITGRFVGKFGWRGQVSSLTAFVSQACAGELGLNLNGMTAGTDDSFDLRRAITVARLSTASAAQAGDPADFKYANFGRDMSVESLGALTFFVASIPRPIEKPQDDVSAGEILKGELLFVSTGCADCHVADLRPTSGMFSDLLLHDMGPRLESPSPAPVGKLRAKVLDVPSFDVQGPFVATLQAYYGSGGGSTPLLAQPYPLAAPEQPCFPRGDVPDSDQVRWDDLQREWRTPPLWGVADTAPYLHDGRAATLEEAILWHGGESDLSRQRYADLPRADKDLVLAFLASLQAPE